MNKSGVGGEKACTAKQIRHSQLRNRRWIELFTGQILPLLPPLSLSKNKQGCICGNLTKQKPAVSAQCC